ncbi:AsnC family transcriptional regulator [Haloterrigena salina JCM 13891]|uniref:AsnC family transcriptional regulator n=1 Tax=Haloterrigena salina JCM 13891 TaxID=1227488 RepID=M0CAI1_9EURY|nr:TrkA C-terminal domain-containing protein [Haloterrigena salina]ELZ19613.1 AsnC family transcriptional regulator [Haloterrigena salina JCM 13891]
MASRSDHRSWQPDAPFGPDEGTSCDRITDFVTLSGDVEVAVNDEAPIADLILEHAVRRQTLPEESLVIAIERGDTVLAPHGETTIGADDIVTAFPKGGIGSRTLDALRRDGPS